MPTVHRGGGFRFVIFTDDHEPAHIHAIGQGGEAKINLDADGRGPRVVWVQGLGHGELRRAMAEVANEASGLMDAWTRIHGGIHR